MKAVSEELLQAQMPRGTPPAAVVLFDEAFHEGVVGIVAGRVKEALHRPTFVFARGADGRLKGSGRSIPGLHLRDALDLLAKRCPGLLARFGGHAIAAGCTLAVDDLATFAQALQAIAEASLAPEQLRRELQHDGSLEGAMFSVDRALGLAEQVWGQAFEPPLFVDDFEVIQQRLVGSGHLKLRLQHGSGVQVEGIWFRRTDTLPPGPARLAYRLDADHYQGQPRLQVLVEALA
jgi:single-stranded-DNA-specific exonuclease